MRCVASRGQFLQPDNHTCPQHGPRASVTVPHQPTASVSTNARAQTGAAVISDGICRPLSDNLFLLPSSSSGNDHPMFKGGGRREKGREQKKICFVSGQIMAAVAPHLSFSIKGRTRSPFPVGGAAMETRPPFLTPRPSPHPRTPVKTPSYQAGIFLPPSLPCGEKSILVEKK